MAKDKDTFKTGNKLLRPEKGKILISEPLLQDAYFQRSVVLLVEHNANGSMGFVLNKQTDLTVNDFFPELRDIPDIPIYMGGPVSSNHLFFIHSLGQEIIPDGISINDELFFDGIFEAVKRYLISGCPVEGLIKFFLGYSGWTKNQLNGEILGNSWIVSQSSSNDIMFATGDSYWNDSVKLLGSPYDAWINYPKDPGMN
jgi:putative transcriptional regulator